MPVFPICLPNFKICSNDKYSCQHAYQACYPRERNGRWKTLNEKSRSDEPEVLGSNTHQPGDMEKTKLPESVDSLREKNHQLQLLVRDLKEFAAVVTHDLRTPLTAMKGFAEMLAELYSTRLDAHGRHLVDRIMANAVHMDEMIRGLRELVVEGEQALARTDFAPVAVARTVMETHAEQIRKRAISIEIQNDLPPIHADPAKFYLILDNLFSNSFKYAHSAHPAVSFGGFQNPDGFVWYVEDNGPGVESENREKVFEVFFQSDKSRPGLGLGLSIVKRVVELYGGKVWIEQGSLGGARFCFTLPDAQP